MQSQLPYLLQPSGLNRTREELSCEDLEQLIQLFLPLGLKHLSLSGGEPTLHSAFDKVLGLTERYPQLQFSLTTNGTTNSRPLIDRMAAASNLALQISLDGSCEEVNANARGRKLFPGYGSDPLPPGQKGMPVENGDLSGQRQRHRSLLPPGRIAGAAAGVCVPFQGRQREGAVGGPRPVPPPGKWRRCVLSTG